MFENNAIILAVDIDDLIFGSDCENVISER